ncbi:UNVERIFIED_ORG: hypothetical protein GGI57_005589 [Rhizobium aethiopicum]
MASGEMVHFDDEIAQGISATAVNQ